jgi:hypothetical protein
MTLPSQSQIDVIATQILLDAKQALTALKGWNNSIKDSQDKMRLFKELIKSTATQMNGDFGAATAAVAKFSNALNVNPALVRKIGKDLKELDAIAQKSLGQLSQKTMESSARMALLSNAIQSMAVKGKLSIDQVVSSLRTLNSSTGTKMGKLGFSDRNIAEAGVVAKKTASSIKEVGSASEQAGKKTKNAFEQVFSSVNAVRIALGALVSMILFQAIQAVTDFFRNASDQARQLEENMWRLQNAERALSKEGVDVSMQGMEDAITRIQQKFKVFSREDITQLYSSIAVATKQLGLSEKQISDLTESVVFLNVQSSKQEDLMSTQASLLSSILGKSSTGISQLGVSFKNEFLEQEAVRLGMIDLGQTINDLSDEQIAHVKVSLLVKAGYVDTAEGIEIVNNFLDTNSAKIQSNKSAWADFSAAVGQSLNNMLPNIVPQLEKLQKSVEVGGVSKLFSEKANKFSLENQAIFWKLATGIKLTQKEYDKLKETLSQLSDEDILKIFPDPAAIKDRFTRELIQSIVDIKDTVTENSPIIGKDDLVDEDAEKALADIEQQVQAIILDAKQAQDDLDLKMGQKQEDLDTEYQRKNEDAARDHAQKLEDIETDTRQKVEDAKRKARENEQKAESDLLQKLKELRQKYLLDLDEALQARDARQVIRLMKEYKLDKQNILDRAKLDEEQRKKDLAAELASIEADRQRKIQNENIDYQRKLQDLAKAKAREQEELQLWYQREQEDIQRNVQQKLEKLLAGYIAEGKIHESEQARIYGILAKYFAQDMALVDSMAAYMTARFAQMSQAAASFNPAPVGSLNYSLGLPNLTNPFAGQYADPLADKMAEGGTVVASRPTTVTFGERGLEAATFTPIDRAGRDVGKIFGDTSGGGVNGQITVAVDLSPDLEARIVDRSMNGVADVVGKINRRKI